ncbi:unnamed protein product [Rotaria socialis]|nr:unnamed protein product [Rotaria socialis]CAF3440165.1 unnamed protein product [Rotaria socialis]CAF3597447.1 unnamed protein product [Rotaria socialis]CAF4229820.1 unnamed protein product [Rotaria socialis]CAF4435643.1 unnamed protein product [Rotaria socialis]
MTSTAIVRQQPSYMCMRKPFYYSNVMIRKGKMDYLTALPAELIHKILSDVPTFDIFLSVFLVNKRLRSISIAYPRFELDFSSLVRPISKNEFDYICTQILYLTPQIVSLKLFDKDDPITPTKNAFFFSKFCPMVRTFSNLQSLTLTYIDYETWLFFKSRLPLSIVKLSIHLVYNGRSTSSFITSETLYEFLLFSPSLEYLSLKMSNYSDKMISIRERNPTLLSSIQHFHLDGITINLPSLFTIVPRLHTLEVSFSNSNRIFDVVHNQPLHIQRLRLELYAITWATTATLLSSLSRLEYLTVIADDLNSDMADGHAWAELLQEIKHFECKLQFYWDAFSHQPVNLDSFRTKFWLEEKKWFIIYEQNIDIDYSILRSDLSSTIDYPSNEIIGILLSESSKCDPTALPTVHCSTVNHQHAKYALLHRYTSIKQLNLTYVDVVFPLNFKDICMYLDISRIVTCYPGNEWISKSPYEMIDFLRNLPNLRALSLCGPILNYVIVHSWPNIRHLRIEHDPNDCSCVICLNVMNAICHSFSYLERFDIHLSCVSNLRQILNSIKKTTVTDVIIRQPRAINSEQFISWEWIKRNTKLLHVNYACDAENSVSLWL